ncbi:MAG: ribose-5-phosphate isomerase RpiA [Chloroflexi bacterium]|nr:ribose-5-phosphate isomerase RpiA [Chloroflexota bacterium]MCC6892141.1 ribose-5-phosphate isomerase RpiA [Anaerolineae bacterium]
MDATQLKRQAAERAVEFIESGMIVGLGHGTTAIWATRRLADLIQVGQIKNILAVPCSKETEAEAEKLGIPLTTLEAHPHIDLTIDGADEVAPNFDVIKGGGGALLREKIVAQASKREIIIVDDSKLSSALGTNWAIPVEVIPFGYGSQQAFLEELGAVVTVRKKNDGTTFYTDQGNIILDSKFGPLADAAGLAEQLKQRTGIVEHGLFIKLVSDVIVAASSGTRQLHKQS